MPTVVLVYITQVPYTINQCSQQSVSESLLSGYLAGGSRVAGWADDGRLVVFMIGLKRLYHSIDRLFWLDSLSFFQAPSPKRQTIAFSNISVQYLFWLEASCPITSHIYFTYLPYSSHTQSCSVQLLCSVLTYPTFPSLSTGICII